MGSTFLRGCGGRITEDPGLWLKLLIPGDAGKNTNNIVMMKTTRRDITSAILRASVYVTVNIATIYIRIKNKMSLSLCALTCRQKWFELCC